MCIADSNASWRSSNIRPPGVSVAPCSLSPTGTPHRHHMLLGPWVSSLLNRCQIYSEHLLKSVCMCLFNIVINFFHVWNGPYVKKRMSQSQNTDAVFMVDDHTRRLQYVFIMQCRNAEGCSRASHQVKYDVLEFLKMINYTHQTKGFKQQHCSTKLLDCTTFVLIVISWLLLVI